MLDSPREDETMTGSMPVQGDAEQNWIVTIVELFFELLSQSTNNSILSSDHDLNGNHI